MVEVREVTDRAALDALAADWRRLVDTSRSATPFQTWEWSSCFWRLMGEGRLWVLVAREGGSIVGIMPLAIRRYFKTPFREVQWLTAPDADYQDFITAPMREYDCAKAFLAYIAEQRGRWDLCDLTDTLKESPLLTAQPAGRVSVRTFQYCPGRRALLPPSWEEYQQSLGSSHRRTTGKLRRRLERELKVQLELVDGPTLTEGMNELFRLHNASWQARGEQGVFAEQRIRTFHHEVARAFLEKDWLRLYRLRVNGETKALSYCFRFRDCIYGYLMGFDLALAKYSPGSVCLSYVIERSIAEGARRLDFMRGDEPYKERWRGELCHSWRLLLGQTTVRSHLSLGLHRLQRYVEQRKLREFESQKKAAES
jgi:CelD/BcsL family acetyltransferase involved in cellulose biosynthesis